jgi:hypothetical protein
MLAFEHLEVMPKVWRQDDGTLSRARLIDKPVVQYQLHVKHEDGRTHPCPRLHMNLEARSY